jgi:hypothetical protein
VRASGGIAPQVCSRMLAMPLTAKHKEEGRKLQYDTFKHLTTLSTGSILIFATLLEKVFVHPHWRALIIVAFAAFVLSILASIMLMILLAGLIMYLEDIDETTGRIFAIAISIAGGGFILGIICFIIFATKNLFS